MRALAACVFLVIAVVGGAHAAEHDDAFEKYLRCSRGYGEVPTTRVTHLDRAALDRVPNNELAFTVLDVAYARTPDATTEQALRLPRGLRLLYAVAQLDSQISNGGLNQYFFNTDGALAIDAIEGLVLFGASDRSRILGEALVVRERERDTVGSLHAEGTLEAFSASYQASTLGLLDKRYDAIPDCLWRQVAVTIRMNPSLFLEQ